jgi:hypothetical protein
VTRSRGQVSVDEVLDVLQGSGELHAVQRNVLVLYALLGGVHHKVAEPGYRLAERLGMTAAGFSRARRELVADEWLEQVDKVGNIPFYRLSDKATGRQTVVQLRA